MNRSAARSTALLVTPVLLLALSGCANNTRQARVGTSPQPSNAPLETNASSDRALSSGTVAAETATGYNAHPADHGEFVLGQSFDADAVPEYYEPANRLSLDQIRIELEAMFEEDRTLVRAAYGEESDAQIVNTIQAIDHAHSDRLKEIVEHIGWPTRDLVGLKATQAAYMVIQHAGHDVEFQNRCLALMVDLVKQGELPASYLALLTDRIRVFSDQPQVFGTQMTMARNELGVMVPTPTVPIEDPQHLDNRRALMGMSPHANFVEAIQVAYEASAYEKNSAFAEVPIIDD